MNDPFELLGGCITAPEMVAHRTKLESFLSGWCGVLCFSRDWQNAMLWSHYGDRHKGICLGLDISSAVELSEPRYVTSREEFDSDRDLEVLLAAAPHIRNLKPSDPQFQACKSAVGRMLLTKFEAWRYEHEVRAFIALKSEQRQGELWFADLGSDIQPAVAILGPRCLTTTEEVKAATADYAQPIAVVRTMLSSRSFEVIAAPDSGRGQ
jgi:hypothetical protein